MKNTKIEWTEKVWNPTIGCDKISAGCKFCYAENFANRLKAIGLSDYKDGFMFKILPHRLYEPLKIKKPTKFFVNSMSDLFHENMPLEYFYEIIEIIKKTPYHKYQILTKRAEKMYELLKDYQLPENIWLGVSVENADYKYRIDLLRKIDAKIRFISFEPLIGAVGELDLNGIHWVIVGGESGQKARQMKIEWIDEIYNQSVLYNVPFFFKQWGTWGADGLRRSKKANGRLFREKEWNLFPVE